MQRPRLAPRIPIHPATHTHTHSHCPGPNPPPSRTPSRIQHGLRHGHCRCPGEPRGHGRRPRFFAQVQLLRRLHLRLHAGLQQWQPCVHGRVAAGQPPPRLPRRLRPRVSHSPPLCTSCLPACEFPSCRIAVMDSTPAPWHVSCGARALGLCLHCEASRPAIEFRTPCPHGLGICHRASTSPRRLPDRYVMIRRSGIRS